MGQLFVNCSGQQVDNINLTTCPSLELIKLHLDFVFRIKSEVNTFGGGGYCNLLTGPASMLGIEVSVTTSQDVHGHMKLTVDDEDMTLRLATATGDSRCWLVVSTMLTQAFTAGLPFPDTSIIPPGLARVAIFIEVAWHFRASLSVNLLTSSGSTCSSNGPGTQICSCFVGPSVIIGPLDMATFELCRTCEVLTP